MRRAAKALATRRSSADTGFRMHEFPLISHGPEPQFFGGPAKSRQANHSAPRRDRCRNGAIRLPSLDGPGLQKRTQYPGSLAAGRVVDELLERALGGNGAVGLALVRARPRYGKTQRLWVGLQAGISRSSRPGITCRDGESRAEPRG